MRARIETWAWLDSNHEVANVMLMQRRYDEAATLMDSLGEIARTHNALPRSGMNHYAQGLYFETIGLIARAQGKIEKARSAFEASRKEYEGWLAQRPDEPTALADQRSPRPGLAGTTRLCAKSLSPGSVGR